MTAQLVEGYGLVAVGSILAIGFLGAIVVGLVDLARSSRDRDR